MWNFSSTLAWMHSRDKNWFMATKIHFIEATSTQMFQQGKIFVVFKDIFWGVFLKNVSLVNVLSKFELLTLENYLDLIIYKI